MVAVPFFCPDTPPLKQNPVFLYYTDNFQKPYPFQADVAVGIDSVLSRKLDAGRHGVTIRRRGRGRLSRIDCRRRSQTRGAAKSRP